MSSAVKTTSATPRKQLLIYNALKAMPPKFAHLLLILGVDRSKMSKRHGATNIADYQIDYLPDALVNFMAQLGYTYEPEIMNRQEWHGSLIWSAYIRAAQYSIRQN